MSIIRKAHNRENPYAQICRKTLQDPNLSFKAKGLLAYLLSLPNDWNISITQLAKIGPDRQTSAQSALQELIKYKYIERQHVKNEKGQFYDWEYLVYEEPTNGGKNPAVENPSLENPSLENPPLLKKIYTKEDNNLKNAFLKKNTKREKTNPSERVSLSVASLTDAFLFEINRYREEINLKPLAIKSKRAWEGSWISLLKKKDEKNLKGLIRFVFEDLFWRQNIQSPSGLLRHFDKLEVLYAEQEKDEWHCESPGISFR